MLDVCTQKDPGVDRCQQEVRQRECAKGDFQHYLSTGFKKPHSGQPAKYCCLVINAIPDESALNNSWIEKIKNLNDSGGGVGNTISYIEHIQYSCQE